MILLLSPAKTLDESPISIESHTLPRLMKQTTALANELKKKSVRSLKKLMDISDQIATLNVERYQQFETPFTPSNAKQAAFVFKGDVYLGLKVEEFDERDLAFAQKHVRILSGLYGLLKPLDLIQPYRLEMGTALRKGNKKNLYEYWGDKITKLLNEDVVDTESEQILNLASNEYFKAIQPKLLKKPVINVQFKENRNGVYKVISFNAKKARGTMAHLVTKEKITRPDALKELVVNDYSYNSKMSDEKDLVFTIG